MNLPGSADASAAGDETTSMDLTEVQPQPRKSLARRVSFASHLHIRLIDGKQAREPQSSSPNPPARNDGDNGDEDEDDDENSHPVHTASRRRSSMRRRSSTGFSEFGEQSMDMDDDDDGADPANALYDADAHYHAKATLPL